MIKWILRIVIFLTIRMALIVWPFTLAAALFIYLKYF
ncbi:hypothetical protein GGE09_004282 [Roseobacter sp. N2S]|nr:hypothetical protein [Roseobacter sp. N2S]